MLCYKNDEFCAKYQFKMDTVNKKKKGKFAKVAWITGAVFAVLIVAILLIPILFKDKILALAKKEAEKMLVVDVDFKDFDLTLLSTFPNITARLDHFKLTGQGEFEGVVLADIERFDAQLNFWDVINADHIQIKGIHVIKPKINVRVLKDGRANYDIMKPDSVKTPEEISEPSSFKLSLQEYSIQNGDIKYDDRSSNMNATIKNITHFGKGDLSEEVFDFETKTEMDALSFGMDGLSYLSKVKTILKANLLMEMTEEKSKFTLRENELSLNALKLSLDGFYEMLEDHDNMDLKLNTGNTSFKELLSLIPSFFLTGYESMIAKGDLKLDGFVKGRMDDKNMPGWDFNLKVANAHISYPDLPQQIKNIAIVANTKFVGGSDLDKITVDVDRFHADFAKNTIDAFLKLRTPMSDPYIATKIDANIDFASLHQVMPMEETAGLKGKLKANVKLDGKMSALDNEKYDQFNATGSLLLSGFNYVSDELNKPVSVDQLKLSFTPKYMQLESLHAQVGKSDFNAEGKIDNYMDYFLADKLLKGDFIFTSKYLDLDELMNLMPSDTGSGTNEVATTSTSSDEEPISIPSNIHFKLNTKIDEAVFNGVQVKNIHGGVSLKEEVAALDNLTMSMLGGQVGLAGLFNAQNPHKPKADFAYSLQDIDIKELVSNFLTVGKLAPVAKYATGKISSKLQISTAMTAQLEPIFSTLSGDGDFLTKAVTISGFEPMTKIGNALKMDKLNKQTIQNVSAKFKFEDGKVKVQPFQFKMGNITSEVVEGYTSFDQKMDYTIKMFIPKEDIPNSILSLAEKGIDKVSAAVPQISLKKLPAQIPINVKIIGELLNPKVTTDLQDQLIALSGNVKAQAVDLGKQTIAKAKDSIKTIYNTKVDETKAKVNAEKENQKKVLLEEAQKQANAVKQEGKKAGDAIRDEAAKQSDKLLAEAGSNPIKKKAAELASNKIKKEADEKATKVEAEAAKKADDLLSKAQDKADKL